MTRLLLALLLTLSGCVSICRDNPNNMQCMSAEQIEQRLGEKL